MQALSSSSSSSTGAAAQQPETNAPAGGRPRTVTYLATMPVKRAALSSDDGQLSLLRSRRDANKPQRLQRYAGSEATALESVHVRPLPASTQCERHVALLANSRLLLTRLASWPRWRRIASNTVKRSGS